MDSLRFGGLLGGPGPLRTLRRVGGWLEGQPLGASRTFGVCKTAVAMVGVHDQQWQQHFNNQLRNCWRMPVHYQQSVGIFGRHLPLLLSLLVVPDPEQLFPNNLPDCQLANSIADHEQACANNCQLLRTLNLHDCNCTQLTFRVGFAGVYF